LVPEADSNARLVFLCADFVKYKRHPAPQHKRQIKCVVWDLDNTLWDGVLIGGDRVRLRAGIPQLLKYLNERGILLSIASNNDHQSAWKELTRLGVADYFLYPQIDWTAKSRNITAIAEQLGIGLDTLAFVDDNPFELDEAAFTLPGGGAGQGGGCSRADRGVGEVALVIGVKRSCSGQRAASARVEIRRKTEKLNLDQWLG
jgi:HAD superfamily phosphatase (TIGR01681 family)